MPAASKLSELLGVSYTTLATNGKGGAAIAGDPATLWPQPSLDRAIATGRRDRDPHPPAGQSEGVIPAVTLHDEPGCSTLTSCWRPRRTGVATTTRPR
jgi:hypothetical protein